MLNAAGVVNALSIEIETWFWIYPAPPTSVIVTAGFVVYPPPGTTTLVPVIIPDGTAFAVAPEPVATGRFNPEANTLLCVPTETEPGISLTSEFVPLPDVMQLIGFSPVNASAAVLCNVNDLAVITRT